MEHDDELDMAPSGNWSAMNSVFKYGGGNTLDSRVLHGHVSKAMAGLSVATSAVGQAHNLTMVGVAGAAVLGAGTAGVGLGVAGIAMSAVGIGTSIVSGIKTHAHIDALEGLQMRGSMKHHCNCKTRDYGDQMSLDHDTIFNTVLPYVIAKKKAKRVKKGFGATGLSMGTNVHRLGKAIYKSVKGTKGKNRSFYAEILARHAVTHECDLVAGIVSELYTGQDYLAIRAMRSDQAALLIAAKMKSV